MSIVQDVKFTWVIISSDKELSVNIRYLGNGSSPPVLITATALTKLTNQLPNTTIGGSQLLNAGWVSPNSLTIPVEGGNSLYDADLVTVVASPSTGLSNISNPVTPQMTTEPTATPEPGTSESTTNEPTAAPERITISPSETTPPTSNQNNCDSSYPDLCIPLHSPLLTCDQILAKNFRVLPPDPHGFDNDKDGIGCES
jgi:hypothetical protein